MERPTDSIGELETTGEGVGVAVFDSGIFPHPSIDDNLAAVVTFGKTSHGPDTDKKGHGTATAAVIAGNGKGSNGQIKGVAPGAKLINVQEVFSQLNPSAIAQLMSPEVGLRGCVGGW